MAFFSSVHTSDTRKAVARRSITIDFDAPWDKRDFDRDAHLEKLIAEAGSLIAMVEEE